MSSQEQVDSWLASDKMTRVLGWVTAAVVVIMLGLAGVSIPKIASNTEASRRTDDLASCRAEFAAQVDDAYVRLFDAYGDVQSGLGSGLVAAIRQDPTTLALVAAEIEAAQEVQAKAIDELAKVSQRRSDAIALSREDPDAFLAECGE